jgi:hypothetical protein
MAIYKRTCFLFYILLYRLYNYIFKICFTKCFTKFFRNFKTTSKGEMTNLSPKIEIINHYDDLIHQIDIDIEESIKNYKENQILGELVCFPVENRTVGNIFKKENFDSNELAKNNKCETVNEWSESTKVSDYLNQVRQRTIEELRKVQEDSLECLKSRSCNLNQIKESKDAEEMKCRLFADKFYFQVLYETLRKNKIF